MCREYDESREILSDLIFELGSFTEAELKAQFVKMRGGKIQIGRMQTIRLYLDDLRELGALGYEHDRFFVLKQAALA